MAGTRRMLGVLAILAVVVSAGVACDEYPNDPPPPSHAASPSPRTTEEGPPAYPLTSTPRAAGTVSGIAGAGRTVTLKARSPGGARFTLRLPKDAFGSPVEVSMTPLESVSGFGDGVEAEGVRLEPSGLTLAAPATLVVSGGAADSSEGLAWSAEEGQDAGLAWMDPTAPGVQVEVNHFSDVVVTEQQPPRWGRTVPFDNLVSAEYQTVIATLEYVADATAAGMIRSGNLNQPDMVQIINRAVEFLELYVDALAAHLETLASSQSVAGLQDLERDIAQMLAIERHLQLMGYDTDGFATQAILRLTKKIAAALSRFCEEKSSPEAAVTIIGILRQFLLAGGADEKSLAEMERAVERCLMVRVDIDIHTRACFPSTHDDCEPWRYDRARFFTSLNGPPVTVPFHGGEMTLESVTLTMSKEARPVPPLKVPRPDGAEVRLQVIAENFAYFYGSYENADGGSEYWVIEDPFHFRYRRPWTMGSGSQSLAVLAVNQYGGNGRESTIVIEIFHDPRR